MDVEKTQLSRGKKKEVKLDKFLKLKRRGKTYKREREEGKHVAGEKVVGHVSNDVKKVV